MTSDDPVKHPPKDRSTAANRTAAFLLFVGLLFHCIAMGATWWAASTSDRVEHIGLWRFCAETATGWESCDDFIQIQYSDWLKASQSFYVMALFMFMPCLGFVFLVNYRAGGYSGAVLTTVATVVTILITAALTTISLAVFGTFYQTYFRDKEANWADENVASLSWCFVLACCGCACTVLSAGLVLFACKHSTTNQSAIEHTQKQQSTGLL